MTKKPAATASENIENAIARAFLAACDGELSALKPGNVHVFAGGHDMEVEHFKAAARAAAPFISNPALSVGTRIEKAVEASMAAAGCNTNLGILLLTSPLAKAAENASSLAGVQTALRTVLAELNQTDAAAVYAAIRHANPGGLGTADEGDVNLGPGAMTLLEAMRRAAHFDRIAKAYITDFNDIFTHHLPALGKARDAAGQGPSQIPDPRAVTALYMTLLEAFPDSHIVRKFSLPVAEKVQNWASELKSAWSPVPATAAAPGLLALDQKLKAEGLNPGTTADFVVATLFLDRLKAELSCFQ